MYVGNLDDEVDEKDLITFFKNYFTSIRSARVIFDSTTGKSRGYGFINLTDYFEYFQLLKSNKPFILHDKILIIK